jgi:hypothetical protein
MSRFVLLVVVLFGFAWSSPALAVKPQLPEISDAQKKDLDAGKLIFITDNPEKGPSVVTGLAEIRVSSEKLWALLLDTSEGTEHLHR